MKSKSGTWYKNKSANKIGSNTEKMRYFDIDEKDESRIKESKIQKKAT